MRKPPSVGVRPPGWVGVDAVDASAALIDWSERAEELGLDMVFVGDRLLPQAVSEGRTVYGATMLDAGSVLAAIAARTSRVRFGPLVLVLPFRHPIQVAKLTASLDVLSGGRLILGAGLGWNPSELAAFEVPARERGVRFELALEILRDLWCGQSVSCDRFWHFQDVGLAPLPVQVGGPPIWMGSFSPGSALDWEDDVPSTLHAALERVGKLADAWVPLIYSASARRRIAPEVLARAWERVLAAAAAAGRSRPEFVLSDWIYVLDGRDSIRRCQAALRGFFDGDWADARRTYSIGTAAEICETIAETTRAIDRVDEYVLTPLSAEVQQLDAIAQGVAPALRRRGS